MNILNTKEFRNFLQNELDNDACNKIKQYVMDNPNLRISKKLRECILKYDNDLAKENQRELDRLYEIY